MKKERKVWLVLMIVVMAMIFIFSSQQGATSEVVSDSVLAKIIQAITGSLEPISSTMPIFMGLSFRKFAHIFIFAMLGVTAIGFSESWWKAALICYGYACFDEVHQLFVPGRAGQLRDTLIDAIGFGTVIIIWLLLRTIVAGTKKESS